MTKIVINRGIGGFVVSDEAVHWMRARGNPYALAEILFGEPYPDGSGICDYPNMSTLHRMPRNDEDLVAVVETLGERSFGEYSQLKVVEIPDDVDWEVVEYDPGFEEIHERHRSWK